MLSLSLALSLALLPFFPIPHSILPVDNSQKYSADLMRDYHCNKLIGHKRMFHLGIAPNTLSTVESDMPEPSRVT
jgi:hypothetical protein